MKKIKFVPRQFGEGEVNENLLALKRNLHKIRLMQDKLNKILAHYRRNTAG